MAAAVEMIAFSDGALRLQDAARVAACAGLQARWHGASSPQSTAGDPSHGLPDIFTLQDVVLRDQGRRCASGGPPCAVAFPAPDSRTLGARAGFRRQLGAAQAGQPSGKRIDVDLIVRRVFVVRQSPRLAVTYRLLLDRPPSRGANAAETYLAVQTTSRAAFGQLLERTMHLAALLQTRQDAVARQRQEAALTAVHPPSPPLLQACAPQTAPPAPAAVGSVSSHVAQGALEGAATAGRAAAAAIESAADCEYVDLVSNSEEEGAAASTAEDSDVVDIAGDSDDDSLPPQPHPQPAAAAAQVQLQAPPAAPVPSQQGQHAEPHSPASPPSQPTAHPCDAVGHAALQQELARALAAQRSAEANASRLDAELAAARRDAERQTCEHREALAAADRQTCELRRQLVVQQAAAAEVLHREQRAAAALLEQRESEAAQLRLQLAGVQRKLMAGKAAAAALQQQRDASHRRTAELQQRLAEVGEAQQREALELERGQEVLRFGFQQAQFGRRLSEALHAAASRYAAERALSTEMQRREAADVKDRLECMTKAVQEQRADCARLKAENAKLGGALERKCGEVEDLKAQLRASAAAPKQHARSLPENERSRRGSERSDVEPGEIRRSGGERKRRRSPSRSRQRDGDRRWHQDTWRGREGDHSRPAQRWGNGGHALSHEREPSRR